MQNNQFEALSLNNTTIQKLLNWIGFFIAFPFIDLLGNSIYFYFLLLLLYYTLKIKGKIIKLSFFCFFLFLLFIVGLISSLFHPELEVNKDIFFINQILIVIKFGYWFVLAMYFATWFKEINLYLLSKYISYGLLLHIITYYFLPFKLDLVLFSISTIFGRNALVFDILAFSGFLLYYLYIKYKLKGLLVGNSIIILSLFFSEGRAGSVLGVFVFLSTIMLISTVYNYFIKLFIFVFLLFYILFSSQNYTIYDFTSPLAPFVEKINPRFSDLLKGEGDGDLTRDKSWLLREAMVDKTFEILEKHPFLGVGWGNFKNYKSELNSLNHAKYNRLSHVDDDVMNTRSAHNSYAAFSAETGILGFIILLIVLLPIVFYILYNYFVNINNKIMFFIAISFFSILIHMYAITALTGTNFWVLLGIMEGMRNYKSNKLFTQ